MQWSVYLLLITFGLVGAGRSPEVLCRRLASRLCGGVGGWAVGGGSASTEGERRLGTPATWRSKSDGKLTQQGATIYLLGRAAKSRSVEYEGRFCAVSLTLITSSSSLGWLCARRPKSGYRVISSAFIAASAIVSTVSGFSTVSPLRRSKCAAATRPLHMSVEEMEMVTLDCEERMDKTMSNLADNLLTIRTGRANANMLDRVEADYYGAMTPINQMATISVPSSQQLQISPFDKSSLVDIEKAIIYSGLGFTPNNDGNVLRINIPQLTEDRRKELLKQCKSIGEEAKVAIRNIRRDGVDSIKKMEKAGDLGEDQALDGIDEIQKATDKHVKQVDESVSKKEKEVTTL
ncbi:hypothetical protein THAOC_31043 [Thalassiosira oceanica]|uniref:Ribosome recycling factor domain-containing protein n=1 Tax=Thalassiosira oceanica TaxID=159749 RepID=K0RA38_THAOC|nr:hypothetical protein THAOC_31043 [Thalassiosira oceanica]|eukprot:EJK50025.1 hypothetical protein THAOC_31043 [Thalassiosira oceanica]